MISACDCFRWEPLFSSNHNTRVVPMKGKILLQKKGRPFCVKLWAKPESKLWLALCVDLCKFCKTEKCMLHLYRCVLYTSHCFSSRACTLWRGFCESPCLSVSHLSVSHVPHKPLMSKSWTGRVFLPGTVVFCESLFSALLKVYTGTKLFSVLSRSHDIKLVEWFVLFDLEAGETRRVLFFSFMQHIAATTVFIFLLYLLSMVLI